MKNIILLILISFTSILYAKINTVVSILPQKTFLKKIGGKYVNITVMVQPGSSPHTYEPKPSQMKDISKADIYFSIDVEFEKVWLDKFINQNKTMIVSDLSKGIIKQNISNHSHTSSDEKSSKHHHETLDPHIWTSTVNVKIISKNILNTLIQVDKEHKDYYLKNYNNFLKEIDNTKQVIQNILNNKKEKSKFMVFHPAWQYFASEFGLIQLSIEIDGKSPKPRELIYIIKEAKEEKIKAIFTAPEFSTKSAKLLAKQLNIKVIAVSPLNPSWSKNLINLAKAIKGKN